MHLLLAASSTDYVELVKQSVRLYNELFQESDLSPDEQHNVCKLLVAAEIASGEARRDQSAVTCDIDKILAIGKTLIDLHDAQIQEMNDRILEQDIKRFGEGEVQAEKEENEDEAQGHTP
ncbi:hypothetical protein CGLO_04489 [Colletotrichum gloeosporioides Cg-14]|uniref:Uncharacterized protein n=1 Tax=Colletotrichum gloeosporioides (strain Cg-14) TaxID=1237896 RepID=T0M481_COLGC|nr:hypothetical protein CGLO_04489 [Colletotrichum gloeosporioides Cg-14]